MIAALDGYAQRRRIEHEQALALAWHIEAFAREKRLPPLAKVLGRSSQPTEAQSEAEMLAAMRAWAALTRGEKPS